MISSHRHDLSQVVDGRHVHDAHIASVHRRYHRRAEQFAVADGGEVEVQDDGVVHRQSHEDSDQVVLPQVALLVGAEPVAPGVRMVHEHPVVRVEDLSDQQQKPFLRQPSHVQSRLPDKRHFQLFLQILLFACYLKKRNTTLGIISAFK